MMPDFILRFWKALSPGQARLLGHIGSLVTGLLIAVMLHYLLYRIGLPGQPFIYVVF